MTAVRATRVTNAMMIAAAAAAGDAAAIRHDLHGTLLPDQIDRAIDRARWLRRYRSDHRVVSR